MSYILDALRKSERERDRGAIPALSTSPRVEFYRPAMQARIGIGVGIVVAVATVAWLVYQSRFQPQGPEPASTTAAGEAPVLSKVQTSTTGTVDDAASSTPDPQSEAAASPDEPKRVIDTARLDAETRALLENLTVNVVSYSEVPERRFVMLNQRIVRESEAVANGIVVKRILPGGAVLAVEDQEILVHPN